MSSFCCCLPPLKGFVSSLTLREGCLVSFFVWLEPHIPYRNWHIFSIRWLPQPTSLRLCGTPSGKTLLSVNKNINFFIFSGGSWCLTCLAWCTCLESFPLPWFCFSRECYFLREQSRKRWCFPFLKDSNCFAMLYRAVFSSATSLVKWSGWFWLFAWRYLCSKWGGFLFFLPSILRCVSNTRIYFSYGYIPGLPNLFLKLTWELGKQNKHRLTQFFPNNCWTYFF